MAALSSSSSSSSLSSASTPIRRSALHGSLSSAEHSSRQGGTVSFSTAPDEIDRLEGYDADGCVRRSSAADLDTTPTLFCCGIFQQAIQIIAVRIGCQDRLSQAMLAIVVAVVSYQLAISEVGFAVHRLCSFGMTIFCVASCFCALALYLKDAWTNTAIYVLFATCFAVEIGLGSLLLTMHEDNEAARSAAASILLHPVSTLGVLIGAGIACLLSPLDSSGGTLVVVLVSLSRYLASTMLGDFPPNLRPLLGYAGGLFGVIAARYMEARYAVLRTAREDSNGNALQIPATANQFSKVVEIKRRRSSTSATNSYSSHCSGRRISLPTLVHKSQGTTVSLDGTLVREAEGLLADMMADPDVPRHLVGGLRAVSQILKSTDSSLVFSGSTHRINVSPVASLSDCADLPYTEKMLYLPKRARRSLPQSLTRCRSTTGAWTTTTSATGMPSLESDPAPRRSKLSVGGFSSLTGNASLDGGGTSSTTRLPPPRRLLTSDYDSSDSPSGSERHVTGIVGAEMTRQSSMGDGGQDGISSSGDEVDTRESTPQPVFDLGTDKNGVCVETSYYQGGDVTATHVSDSSTQTNFSRKNSSARSSIVAGQTRSGADEWDSPMRRATGSWSSESARHHQQSVVTARHPAADDVDLSLYLNDNDAQSTTDNIMSLKCLSQWDYPIFSLAESNPRATLSRVAYKLFTELGFMTTFNIPVKEFINYFHALELGYRDKPYHNRIHASDVLHACYFMTSQPVPGFTQVLVEDNVADPSSASSRLNALTAASATDSSGSYGVIGANFMSLELMALYTAAAMHDYDHPGRTNAFLVSTSSPLAILYNDRSVLENHHASAAWRLLLSDERYSWLVNLDYAEFKRFRFLVVEAILATDLKRHFDLLAEFNAKLNDDLAPGVDWTSEPDRLMVSNMIIKMADINGPCKGKELHLQWTERIIEEFYEQGDDEASLGLTISPYMNRRQPQLAKLQESFINHLVAPLCNALSNASLLPGVLLDESEESDVSSGMDEDDIESPDSNDLECKSTPDTVRHRRKPAVQCVMVQNLEENHDMWVKIIKAETQQSEQLISPELSTEGKCQYQGSGGLHSDILSPDMGSIKEEDSMDKDDVRVSESGSAHRKIRC